MAATITANSPIRLYLIFFFMLPIPNLPCGKGLQQQHLESVFGDGPLGFAFLHEECFIWII